MAAVIGRTFDFEPQFDDTINIFKNGEIRNITVEQFDSLFCAVGELFEAALREDCILFRYVDDGMILLNNFKGEEKLVHPSIFYSMYKFF